jgi:bacteriocin-like protein
MKDNELPPIEGELSDEDLKQVSGGLLCVTNSTGGGNQNNQGDDNSQGNEDQGNTLLHRRVC